MIQPRWISQLLPCSVETSCLILFKNLDRVCTFFSLSFPIIILSLCLHCLVPPVNYLVTDSFGCKTTGLQFPSPQRDQESSRPIVAGITDPYRRQPAGDGTTLSSSTSMLAQLSTLLRVFNDHNTLLLIPQSTTLQAHTPAHLCTILGRCTRYRRNETMSVLPIRSGTICF